MTYQIMPFNFSRFNENEVLLTNMVGEYAFLGQEDFKKFVKNELEQNSEAYKLLESRQILTEEKYLRNVIKMLAVKYRTKKSILKNFTALHMVVPTLRCNSSCIYCQVARKRLDDQKFDMTKATADNVLKNIFMSPSDEIKIEFQGGDPSVNFEMVKYIIEKAEIINLKKKKQLEFVICTNMVLLDAKKIKYLKAHKCCISTSLDGPEDLHNLNRPLQDKSNTYQRFIEKLRLVREITNDAGFASPLMTASKYSLGRFKDIIDEYIRLGYHNIFLRSLNPYGFAKRYKEKIAYPIEDFIENYLQALQYIIEVNKSGYLFVEGYAAMLLRRILTPFTTGFVDLQSPAAVGIGCALYDYNGDVFVSDEGRMLSRFKDYYFKIGNVNSDSYDAMFNGEKLHSILNHACNECLPECATCVFQPYCGADPVRNYSEQGDMVGFRPLNEMCRRNKAIFNYLFSLIKEDDKEVNQIFWSWIEQ